MRHAAGALVTAGVPIAPLLQAYFTGRLLRDRQASTHTIAAYRDTFRLLLDFAQRRLGRPASGLHLADLDAPFVAAFLQDLESSRRNGVRTRNARLAAIHSFFRYLAVEEPSHAALIQRVLAMPNKRYTRKPIDFLAGEEMEALLAAPDQHTWIGRRDHLLLLLAMRTGLRVSELTGLQRQDVALGAGAHVRCHGKGRKERSTPLRPDVAKAIKGWFHEHAAPHDAPLLPTSSGQRMSRDAVEQRIAKYADMAATRCPSLRRKRVSPHVLRHYSAPPTITE